MGTDNGGGVYLATTKAGNHTPLIAHTATDSAVPGPAFAACSSPTLCVELDATGKGTRFSGQGTGNSLSFALFPDGAKSEGAGTGLSCDPGGTCVATGSRRGLTTFRPDAATSYQELLVPTDTTRCPL